MPSNRNRSRASDWRPVADPLVVIRSSRCAATSSGLEIEASGRSLLDAIADLTDLDGRDPPLHARHDVGEAPLVVGHGTDGADLDAHRLAPCCLRADPVRRALRVAHDHLAARGVVGRDEGHPQIGHCPGAGIRTDGCIGHV
jgi:hypothetical protein